MTPFTVKTRRCVVSAVCSMLPLFALISCSSLAPDSGVVITSGKNSEMQLGEADVVKFVEEWQQAKPGIERLTELEADLAFLIAEVSKMSDLNTAPQRYADDALQPDTDLVENGDNVIVATMAGTSAGESAAATEPAASTTEETLVSAAPSSDYGLHLASFLKPYSAKFGWYLVNKEYPSLFAGLNPKLQLIQKPNQTLYSLRVGPFASEAQAKRACIKLQQRNYRCQPADFSGEPLVDI